MDKAVAGGVGEMPGVDRAKPLSITLVGIASQYVHASLAPWCLLQGLAQFAQAPYYAQVAEGTVNEPQDKVLSRLVETKPDVLALCCYIWNITYIKAMLPWLRENLPHCHIVLGGPEVSYRPADILQTLPQVDSLIAGEGELPLALLVDALSGIGKLSDVPGLWYREGDVPVGREPHVHPALPDSPIGPAYLAALSGRIAYIETSRGCPYSCAFCLSGRGERLREQPLDQAFADLMALANSGSRTIKLVDRTFNANRKRAREILAFLSAQADAGQVPPGVTFHFEIAGDLLDPDTLAIIKTARPGLFQFEIGLQSMDESVLSANRRRTDLGRWEERVRALIALTTAHVHLDLIAGLKNETLAGFIQGFDRVYALSPQALQLGFLKVIHGSAIRENPGQYPTAFDPDPPYQVLDTPWMSREDLFALSQTEVALDRLHNSGRFARTLRFLTVDLGLSPYQLFFSLGQAIHQAGTKAQSLDALTCLVYNTLCALHPQHQDHLRDLLLWDRLAATPTTVLPPCLKRRDKRYFQVKRALDMRYPRKPGVARAVAFLYQGGERAVFCDYDGEKKAPVTGLYPLHEVGLEGLV